MGRCSWHLRAVTGEVRPKRMPFHAHLTKKREAERWESSFVPLAVLRLPHKILIETVLKNKKNRNRCRPDLPSEYLFC